MSWIVPSIATLTPLVLTKLIPSWGRTEQPGSTYYLQKVSHDVFGIVDHSVQKSTVYIFDERIALKTLATLFHC